MKKKIVTIGGGTGSFVTLSGLKNYKEVELSAIVNMSDDGGDSQDLILQGALPPGDLRQALVALAEDTGLWREVFNLRFGNGKRKGQSFGNTFLSAFQMVTGSIEKAIEEAEKVLQTKGHVIPVVLAKADVFARLQNGDEVKGESKLQETDLSGLVSLSLTPEASANPKALQAIQEADIIVVCPGNLFCSTIPVLSPIVEEVAKARGEVVYPCNLMTKKGHTDGMTVLDFVAVLEKTLGRGVVDRVIFNTERPSEILIQKYREEREFFVEPGDISSRLDIKFVGIDLLDEEIPEQKEGDPLKRTLIRHDSVKLARAIVDE